MACVTRSTRGKVARRDAESTWSCSIRRRDRGAVRRSRFSAFEISKVTFRTEEGIVQAVRGVDMDVYEHECFGVVGESGSGKSVTMLACSACCRVPRKITARPNSAAKSSSARTASCSVTCGGEHRDDLPGSAHRVEPRPQGRGSTLGGVARPRLGAVAVVAATRAVELLDQVGIRRPGSVRASTRTSSRAGCGNGR